jgi:tRNA-specific 2-thiouridylase
MKRVVIAMSGGVDSSAAAALLVEAGYDVIGIMLRLWSEPSTSDSNRCCSPDAMALARRVAGQLGIPFYAVDAQDAFHATVVEDFIRGYTSGLTPNPCLICNRQIRWGYLLDHAVGLGADALATGHYARLATTSNGAIQLKKAIDLQKDQSYVLHTLKQEQLQKTIFPIGDLTKADVRAYAHSLDIPSASRSDSQDLCFLAGGNYRDFLLRNSPSANNPGPIQSIDGHILGKHRGLAFYTIGQRKGLGLSSPFSLYVVRKDLQTNTLVVGGEQDLGRQAMSVAEINWIDGCGPDSPFRADVKTRYTAPALRALVAPLAEGKATVKFDNQVRDITPGQAAVIYDGDVCLGGGIIQPFQD